MATRSVPRAAKARSRSSRPKQLSHAGSIADRLERSPGGIAGALARIRAAKAASRPMTPLQLFEIVVSGRLLS